MAAHRRTILSRRRLLMCLLGKVCLGHALMSYLFGTVVIAVAVNLVTNLGPSS